MKHSLLICGLLFSGIIIACEKPLSLRRIYGENLEELRHLQRVGATKLCMYEAAIAHDDVDALKILNQDTTQDPLLVPKDKRTQENLWVTPLHIAAMHGSLQSIDYYLTQRNANIDALTICDHEEYAQQTPAHWAAHFGQHEALIELLNRKANPSLTDKKNRSISHFFSQNKDLKGFAILHHHLEATINQLLEKVTDTKKQQKELSWPNAG